jgi:hypothetical protein
LQLLVGPKAGAHSSGWPVIDELDLVNGDTLVPTRGRRVIVDERNYVQLQAVRGGSNSVSVDVQAARPDSAVASVTALPGSGLYTTQLAPASLQLRAPREVRVRQGGTAVVEVALIDSGDSSRGTRVAISGAVGVARVLGAPIVRVGTVSSQRPTSIRFTIRGAKAGVARAVFLAASSSGQEHAFSNVVVYRQAAGPLAVMVVCAVLFVPSAIMTAFAVRRGRVSRCH